MADNKIAKGTKPDYRVAAKFKGTEQSGVVGAAWRKSDGSISVRLASFVVLEAHPDLLLTLFPNDESHVVSRSQTNRDEIPF